MGILEASLTNLRASMKITDIDVSRLPEDLHDQVRSMAALITEGREFTDGQYLQYGPFPMLGRGMTPFVMRTEQKEGDLSLVCYFKED